MKRLRLLVLLPLCVALSAYAADTSAPTTPSGLFGTDCTGTSVKLEWTPSTDDIAVTSYEVFQNGTSIGTTSVANFYVSGLTPSTAYSFSVRASDAAANWSPQCAPYAMTTWQQLLTKRDEIDAGSDFSYQVYVPSAGALRVYTTGTTDTRVQVYYAGLPEASNGGQGGNALVYVPLSKPDTVNLMVRGETSSVTGYFTVHVDFIANLPSPTVTLSAPAYAYRLPDQVPLTANVSKSVAAIRRYEWDFNGDDVPDQVTVSPTLSVTPQSQGYWTVTVRVRDVNDAVARASAAYQIHAASDSKVTVQNGWNSGSTGYDSHDPYVAVNWPTYAGASATLPGQVFSGWTVVSGNVTLTNANQLTCGVQVTASGDVTVRANYVPDTAAPSVPGAVACGGTGGTWMLLSWPVASDNVGVTGYQVQYNSQVADFTGTSVTLAGLQPSTTYTVAVRARDFAGNWSAWGPSAQFRTVAGDAPLSTYSTVATSNVQSYQILAPAGARSIGVKVWGAGGRGGLGAGSPGGSGGYVEAYYAAPTQAWVTANTFGSAYVQVYTDASRAV